MELGGWDNPNVVRELSEPWELERSLAGGVGFVGGGIGSPFSSKVQPVARNLAFSFLHSVW